MSDHRDQALERVRRFYSIGQTDGAIDILRRVLSEDPDDADAHAWLAACLLRKKRLYAAEVEANMAVTLAPESLFAQWVAAEMAIARRDFGRAGQHIDWLLAAAPQSAEFHRLKARWMSLRGAAKQRLPVLEQALQCDPEDPETLADLADFHSEAGQLEAAERYAAEALGLAPESTAALVAMGNVQLRRGEADGARELAVGALHVDPENWSALALLTSVKARSSYFLALWWRYAVWGARVGPARNIIVLLVAFVVYRVLSITFEHPAIDLAWLAIVVYSFIGPTLFTRALKKELETVQLRNF